MSKRIAYLISGVSALYVAAAPVLSHMPNGRPLWIGVVLWMGATCLVFATITIPGRWREVAAIVGSGLILAVFCYDTLIFPVARKLGYVHTTYRLVALQTTWFDRWRLFLDRPLWLMLMVSSLASLCISTLSLHAQNRLGR
jgi:O-antigen ligase